VDSLPAALSSVCPALLYWAARTVCHLSGNSALYASSLDSYVVVAWQHINIPPYRHAVICCDHTLAHCFDHGVCRAVLHANGEGAWVSTHIRPPSPLSAQEVGQ
jgi:hypothetical protein